MSLWLESLQIKDFRIIARADLSPSPALNIIFGQNAAGKTSVLEAIDLLSRGRSFRSRRLDDMLRRGASELMVAGDLMKSGEKMRLGIAKSSMDTGIRIDGKAVKSVSECAALLPVSVLHPESQELLLGGPAHRRAFLDFGLFHVEHGFFTLWRKYQRVLSQRNAALKQGGKEVAGWNEVLAETGEAIGVMRGGYVAALTPRLQAVISELLGDAEVTINYRPGWSGELSAALIKGEQQDLAKGYTGFGPHRADLDVSLNGSPASLTASRGQLKLIVGGLAIAQLEHLRDSTLSQAIVLIDELPAELDEANQARLMARIARLDMQTFVTSIDPASLETRGWPYTRLFHVKHGRIAPML